ncbi:MAG: type II secretion system F family protein [Candidatus Parcubacteria bacterium]|nr:type II secretion system F family protein [Candidatus Parcubacteria bacterium]
MFSVPQKEKMFFAEHLSLMIKGGISITEALETLRNESKNKTFKKAIGDILKRVMEGETLSKSLENHPKIFDSFFSSAVRVGEESGSLEENLQYLSDNMKSEYEMQSTVKSAMAYPIIIIVMALGIAFGVSFFILPKLTQLFQILGVDLPFLTKILIRSVFILQRYGILILALLVLGVFGFRMLLKIKKIKFIFDKIILSLPFTGPISKNINLARFARIFFTLLKSGMPILDSLEICSHSISNEVYKQKILELRNAVEKGEKISQGLKKDPKIFFPIFSQMVSVGEKSGTLEESFLYLAKFYERETSQALKNISATIEPALLIIVGLFVAFIALAVITPIYKFTGEFKFR